MRNRNEYSTKHTRTVSLKPDCVSTLPGKTKNNTKTADRSYAVHSIEPIVLDFRRKSFNVCFFPYLLENFCSSLLTENLLHFYEFHKKVIFKLNMINFNM